MRPNRPLVFGRIVGPCGAFVEVVVGAGEGVGVLPGDVGDDVGDVDGLPGAGVVVGLLDVLGAPGFAGADGVDEPPPPPPHAVSVARTINVASAPARRNADFSNVWPLVRPAYGSTA